MSTVGERHALARSGRRRRPSRRWKRPPWWLVLATAAGLVAIAVALAWRTEPPIGLPVGDLPSAVASIEQRLGGPRTYSEIKTTADGVTLFVVDDQRERAYFYRAGTLTGPGEAQPLEGRRPFLLDKTDLRVGRKIAANLRTRLPGSQLLEVALIKQTDTLVWNVRSQSPKGGTVESFFTIDGQLLGGALK